MAGKSACIHKYLHERAKPCHAHLDQTSLQCKGHNGRQTW